VKKRGLDLPNLIVPICEYITIQLRHSITRSEITIY